MALKVFDFFKKGSWSRLDIDYIEMNAWSGSKVS